MTRQLEAVFEKGLLRPTEPLLLEESQRVLVTITDITPGPSSQVRKAEQEWLKSHSSQHRGEWVALDGGTLISHGPDARSVRDAARAKGVRRPLMIQVPESVDTPSAGLLQT